MFLESTVLAVIFGLMTDSITGIILSAGSSTQLWEQIMLSLGAGVYEEFLFRVALISGSVFVFEKVFEFKRVSALSAGVVISAFIFSLFHYFGSLGDTFYFSTFTYRFVAGILLGGLYILRGFGVTAYTHSLYDLLIVTEILT